MAFKVIHKITSMLSRKITIFCFLSLTLFSFAQCKTTENKATVQEKPILQPFKSMANNKASVQLNKDKSMELHVKKIIKSGDPAAHFEYVVYKTGTKSIVKQGYFRGTNVGWNDNTSLKLIPYIGMEQIPTSEKLHDTIPSNSQTQITIIKLNN